MPRIADALNFLMNVKLRFQDRNDDYDIFLRLMKFAREFRFEFKVIHMAVASLFKDHPDLFEAFESFLPASRTLLPDEHQDDAAVNVLKLEAQVLNFLLSLRLLHHEFFTVMNIIRRCRERGFDVDRTRTEIQEYVGRIPYLTQEFEKFWNEFTQTTSTTVSLPKPDDQESPKDESNGKEM